MRQPTEEPRGASPTTAAPTSAPVRTSDYRLLRKTVRGIQAVSGLLFVVHLLLALLVDCLEWANALFAFIQAAIFGTTTRVLMMTDPGTGGTEPPTKPEEHTGG